jgi:hypothetical protein
VADPNEATIELDVKGRREVERELGHVDRAIEDIHRSIGELKGDADHTSRAFTDMASDTDRSMRRFADDVNDATARAARDLRGLGDDTDRAARELRDLAGDAERSARRMGSAFDGVDVPSFGSNLGFAAGGVAGAATLAFSALGGDQLLGAVTEPLSAPLTFQGDIAAAAARIGTTSERLLAIIEPIEELRGQFDRQEIASALVAVAEGLGDRAQTESKIVAATDALLALQETGIGDVEGLSRAAANLSGAFGEQDVQHVLDLISGAVQAGGGRTGDLLDTLTEFSTNAADLGLTLEDFIGQIVAGADPSLGLFNLSKVGEALQEFRNTIRAGGEEVEGALEGLGLDSGDIRSSLLAGGEGGRQAFQEVIDALAGLRSASKQENLAQLLFGAPFEALGTGLLDVLDLANTGLDDADGAAQRLSDTLNNTSAGDFGAAVSALRNEVFGVTGAYGNPGLAHSDPFLQREGASGGLRGIIPPLTPGGRAVEGRAPITAFIPEEVRNEINVNVEFRGGLVTADVARELSRALSPYITREIDRQVRRSAVFASARNAPLGGH